MNIIEIRNLSHRFADGSMGLRDVNLSVSGGAFVLLAGPNGSGKTTLLRHLNGLLLPTSGSVELAGIPVHRDLLRARQMVGMVFQDADSQLVGETVRDDVAFGPENLCLEKAEVDRRAAAALKTVGLTHRVDQRPHLLSAGEKRRLAVAGVLAMNPQILVFDEPFSNLDFSGVKQVLRQILSLHRKGHTLLMATHDLETVWETADRLILMKDGQVAADGSPAELMSRLESHGVRAPGRFRSAFKADTWRS